MMSALGGLSTASSAWTADAAGLRRVEGRAAAREDDACARRAAAGRSARRAATRAARRPRVSSRPPYPSLYHRARGRVPLDRSRARPVPRLRRDGPRQQRRLLDLPRAGADRDPRRPRAVHPRPRRDRLPGRAARRRGRRGAQPLLARRDEELRARAPDLGRRTPRCRREERARRLRLRGGHVRPADRRTSEGDSTEHERLRAPHPVERPARADRAAPARPVGRLLRHAGRRLALRGRGEPRHRALRRAHVLQGNGEAPDRARPVDGGRQDRRRVQRVHVEGVHRLLHPLRGEQRDTALDVLVDMLRNSKFDAGGARAREGRDHRGDEHVLRHAARLRLVGLRGAALRLQPARLGDARHEGDDQGGDARDVPRLPRRTGTRRSAWWSASSGMVGDDLLPTLEGLLGDMPGERLRRAGCRRRSSARPSRGCACTTRTPTRRTCASAFRAIRSTIRTATRCSCSAPCSAPACRRVSSSRCASGAASPTTSTRSTARSPTRARSSRRRAST